MKISNIKSAILATVYFSFLLARPVFGGPEQQFQMGVTHINGKYRFTDENYLIEGAKRISDFGSRAIFVYLHPGFQESYPAFGGTKWPTVPVKSLVDLAKTAPYQQLFKMPFEIYALTAFSFQMADAPFKDQHPNNYQDLLAKEEAEFYELTKFLLKNYSGTNKTFILKNWETDWFGLRNYDSTKVLSENSITDLISYFQARQKGVNRARTELNATVSKVRVFHAVEVNLVNDVRQNPQLKRVINKVIPQLKPPADMVSYSAYDSLGQGGSQNKVFKTLEENIKFIATLTPDPLGLGNKRILIGEIGAAEKFYSSTGVEMRLNVSIQVGKKLNLHSGFFWQIYDNEAEIFSGGKKVEIPVAQGLNSALRPKVDECKGYYMVRPDGTEPPFNKILKDFWKQP